MTRRSVHGGADGSGRTGSRMAAHRAPARRSRRRTRHRRVGSVAHRTARRRQRAPAVGRPVRRRGARRGHRRASSPSAIARRPLPRPPASHRDAAAPPSATAPTPTGTRRRSPTCSGSHAEPDLRAIGARRVAPGVRAPHPARRPGAGVGALRRSAPSRADRRAGTEPAARCRTARPAGALAARRRWRRSRAHVGRLDAADRRRDPTR